MYTSLFVGSIFIAAINLILVGYQGFRIMAASGILSWADDAEEQERALSTQVSVLKSGIDCYVEK